MRRTSALLIPIAALVASVAVAAAPASASPDTQPPPSVGAMPSETPSAVTPGITAGTKAMAFEEVGERVYAAGTFTEVGGQPRTGIAAFNRHTGALDTGFAPTVTGQVYTVAAGPTASTVYIGGLLRSVNGKSLSRIALLDAATGAPVKGFKPPAFNGAIQDIKFRAGRLYVGGQFTTAGGLPRGGLASLDPMTGALNDFLTVNLTEHHNTDPSRSQDPIGAAKFDITKDGSLMVLVGNFRKADGLDRDQIVQISLTGAKAAVRPDWQTNRYKPLCFNWATDTYVRGVSLAPDDSYFVVGANGGPNGGTLCDTATRWETRASGSALEPTWVAYSGGDTVWAVAASEHAVYVGGHMRWMNNSQGWDYAGSGAVARPGLAALDPLNGVPLKWNPGRKPRGTAVFGFLVSKDGVWIGSDTDYIGPREFYRPKLAFFPYAGGYTAAATTTPTLPATIYAGRTAPAGETNVLYRVNAGGPEVISDDSGPNWMADEGATNPYRNSGSVTYPTPGGTIDATVPATTPSSVFDLQRWDPVGSTEMQWEFPVPAGTPVQVRLYFADRVAGTAQPGTRVFDVSIDGQIFLNDWDVSGQVGAGVGTMRAKTMVSDGVIDIDFAHVKDNPIINAIEIVRTDVTPTPVGVGPLESWTFDSTTTGAVSAVDTSINWNTTRGAFTVGNKLFYGASTGTLMVAPFDGKTIGTPVAVNPYHDPRWMYEANGSGGFYNGVTPTFYSRIPSVRGMTYASGYLWYTDGTSTLNGLKFSPDSGIVDGAPPTAATSSTSFSDVGGIVVVGGTLYFVRTSTGDLWSIGWTGKGTTGTAVRVSGPSTGGPNWSGRALFLGNPPANQMPVAAFTTQCTGLTCHFDGSGSSDADGTVDSYTWDFGDGASATGAIVDHTYAAGGPVQVTLTVTDDHAATATKTATAEPVDTPAGTGFIALATSTDAFSTTKDLTVPGSVVAGDTLVMAWSGDPASAPADPAGWTRVRSIASGSSFAMVVWSRQATGTDAGTTVTLTQPVAKRTVAEMLVYRGFSGVAASEFSLDSATADHTAPAIAVNSGDLVIHLFGDRSATTSAWSAGAPDTARGSVVGTATTRFSVFASDPTVRSSAGTAAASTATTDSVSTKGAGISVALRP